MADVGRLVNSVVMPGDVIGNVADLEASLEGKSKIKFGPGLREENGVILAYKAGVLRHRKPATYLIDCNQRRVSSKYSNNCASWHSFKMLMFYYFYVLYIIYLYTCKRFQRISFCFM